MWVVTEPLVTKSISDDDLECPVRSEEATVVEEKTSKKSK